MHFVQSLSLICASVLFTLNLTLISRTSQVHALPLNVKSLIDPLQQRGNQDDTLNIRKIKSVFNVPVLTTTAIPKCPTGTQRVYANGECIPIAPKISSDNDVFLFTAIKKYFPRPVKQPQPPQQPIQPQQPPKRRRTTTMRTTTVTIEPEVSVSTVIFVENTEIYEHPSSSSESSSEHEEKFVPFAPQHQPRPNDTITIESSTENSQIPSSSEISFSSSSQSQSTKTQEAKGTEKYENEKTTPGFESSATEMSTLPESQTINQSNNEETATIDVEIVTEIPNFAGAGMYNDDRNTKSESEAAIDVTEIVFPNLPTPQVQSVISKEKAQDDFKMTTGKSQTVLILKLDFELENSTSSWSTEPKLESASSYFQESDETENMTTMSGFSSQLSLNSNFGETTTEK